MRQFFLLAGLVFVVLFSCVENIFAQANVVVAEKETNQSIAGPWHADSVTLISTGAKKTLPISEQKPFSIIISDKNMVMRVGEQIFADMSYTSDVKQSPSTIDVKFQDQEMPGIFELNGDSLKITLNDSKKGRPTGFDDKDNDMILVLKRFQGEPLFISNPDGSDLQTFTTMSEFTACGSPAWSHDGKNVALDAWRSLYGESYYNSHIIVVNSDGKNPKDLGDGAMPSWSTDGKRIAFSRYISGNSVWIMNADGSDIREIEQNAWCIRWSPKKDEVAYTKYGGNGANICILDLKTKDRRYLLNKDYRQIYWGFAWSLDTKWICFQGVLPDGSNETAIVSTAGQEKGFKTLFPNKEMLGVKETNKHFAWSHDGKQILLSLMKEDDKKYQFYILDLDGKTQPKRIANQNSNQNNWGACWSPDGKKIVFASYYNQ